MQYFKYCGAAVEKDRKFCPKCGRKLSESTDNTEDSVDEKKVLKKRRFHTVIILVPIAITACLVMVLYLLLSGRSNPQKREMLLNNEDQFEHLNLEDTDEPMIQAFRNKISYQRTGIEWKGNTGTAEVTVYTPDLSKAIQQGISDALAEAVGEEYQTTLENAERNIQECLESDNCPMKELQITMETKKNGDEVILISNDDFERAITGNLEELFFNTLTEEIANEKDE